MNRQSQWLFETPFPSNASYYSHPFVRLEFEDGEEEWEGSVSPRDHNLILGDMKSQLQRNFAGPNDPRLLERRRKLRELFNEVQPSKAKDLFDQLQKKSDPLAQLFRNRIHPATFKEMLSILFFAEYDLRFEPGSTTSGIKANPRMTASDKTERITDVSVMTISLGPPPNRLLIIRRDERAKAALKRDVPLASPVPSTLRLVAQRLSDAQLALYREFFPDGTGGINFVDFWRSFEQFANGELRNSANPGQREPNGGFFFLFAEFAFLCIDSGIDKDIWAKLLRVFVQTQEIMMHIYRPNPHPAPPLVGAPLPVPCDPPRSLDDFLDDKFNADGQSNSSRILALRKKYASMTPAALRNAAKDNMLRAQCMP